MQLNYQGVILLNKPKEWTSFDVVAKSRGILATRKVGHSGTLDPMATGVLPLFLGRATKAVDMQIVQDKEYIATFKLGMNTDTSYKYKRSKFKKRRSVGSDIFFFRGN